MRLNLRQLVQKIQTEDTENPQTDSADVAALRLFFFFISVSSPQLHLSVLYPSPQVSTSISCRQVLPIGADSQHPDPGLAVSLGLLRVALQVLRVLPHVQNPLQVLEDGQECDSGAAKQRE